MSSISLVIPAQAGIQQFNNSALRINKNVDPLCGVNSFNWIPACAGMTV
jgi:hypothetical protein